MSATLTFQQQLILMEAVAEMAAHVRDRVAGGDAAMQDTLDEIEAVYRLIDDQTIEETAPGAVWRTNGVYTLPAHTRTTRQKASPSWTR